MHIRGIGYAVIGAITFGLGAVLAQLLGEGMDAAIAALLSLAGGGLLLSACLLLAGTPLAPTFFALKRRDWIDLLLLSGVGTALPLLLIVNGLQLTNALVGGFLLQLNGVAALCFAVLLLRERIRWKQMIGIALLLGGSVLVIFKSAQGLSLSGGLGDLLVFLGAVSLGFGFVPAKRLAARVESLPLTAYRLVIGAIMIIPVLIIRLLTAGQGLLWRPSPMLWGILVLYIVTSFCLGYVTQQEAFRLLKAWEVGAMMQTVPLFSTIFALLLLHDSMTLLQVVGGLVAILGGLVVVLSDRKPAVSVL
jgi:drug/metabolite transporter (DMT)-like permease